MPKDHLDTPQHYWENVLWTNRTIWKEHAAHLDQDCLPLWRGKWITKCIRISYRIIPRWLKLRRSWVTQQDNVNLLQNGFRDIKSTLWSGPVKPSTFTPDVLRIWVNWSSSVRKNGPKLLLDVCRFNTQLQKALAWGYCCQRWFSVIKALVFLLFSPSLCMFNRCDQ